MPDDRTFYHGTSGTYEFKPGDLLTPEATRHGMSHVYYTSHLPSAARYATYGEPLGEHGIPDLNAEARPGHVYAVQPETKDGKKIGRHAEDPWSGLPGNLEAYRTKGRLRVLHEVDRETGEPLSGPGCITAALEAESLRNPYHGTEEFGGRKDWAHTWFHGTKGDNPDLTTGRPADPARGPGQGWPQPNKLLGTHFSPLHSVAHEFAFGTYPHRNPGDEGYYPGTPSSIAHAELNFRNPAHYPTEHHLNVAVARWASGHFPGWHDDKLNKHLAWNYSDHEGTHRNWDAPAESYEENRRLGNRAQAALQWHPRLPEIARGFGEHLRATGHEGIVYGNMVEGPGGWGLPADQPKSFAAIATHPDQIRMTHTEHIAAPRSAPESGEVSYDQSAEMNEPGEMNDRIVGYHTEHQSALPFKLASAAGALDEELPPVVAHFEDPKMAKPLYTRQKLFHMQPDPTLNTPESGRHNPADPLGHLRWRAENDDDYEPDECEHCGGDRNFPEQHAEQHHDWMTSQDWHTDWDEAGVPETIHRGIGVELPRHVEDIVHDESRPHAERAHALMSHLLGGSGLGNFWSASPDVSKHYAEGRNRGFGGADTPVMFHARGPEQEHIETDPDQLQHWGVYSYHLAGNQEVPLQHGAPVHITGISWGKRGHQADGPLPSDPKWHDPGAQHFGDDPAWTHHEFPDHIRATASGALSAAESEAQQRALSVVAHFGDPDFRDHLGNTCTTCGEPVHFARGQEMRGRHPWKHSRPQIADHPAEPSDPSDKTPSRSMTYGGTGCLMCHEPVKINLAALGNPDGGWHHADGMRRDHPAIPQDAQAVYDSIPGVKAQFEQARQEMSEHLHRQFEQLSGHPLPRRPRGDEDEMPPDPFLAALNPPQRDTSCFYCGEPLDDDEVRNEQSAHEECEDMRWCEPHQEHHDDPGVAEQHNATYTDWGNHLPFKGGIHRGLTVKLPPEVHAVVHDESRPDAERAGALVSHLNEEPLGVHWTDHEPIAAAWGSGEGALFGPSEHERSGPDWTHVVVHAASPHEDHIEDDPEELERRNMWGFDHAQSEREIPVRSSAPVSITGVSWKQAGRPDWRRHTLAAPVTHTAALEHGAENGLTWEEIADRHPRLYGDPDTHGYDPEYNEGHGSDIAEAAGHLAYDRPGHEYEEEGGADRLEDTGLRFHQRTVDPSQIDYMRTEPDEYDHRVEEARRGYRSNPEQVPPLVLVHRHGVYQVADGHHRSNAADESGKAVRAYVAYSPHEDEPFSDGGKAPFHGVNHEELTADEDESYPGFPREEETPAGHERIRRELAARYSGGDGHMGTDERGRAYYQTSHHDPAGQPTGWHVRDYGLPGDLTISHDSRPGRFFGFIPHSENAMDARSELERWHRESPLREGIERTDPDVKAWRESRTTSLQDVVAHFEGTSAYHPEAACPGCRSRNWEPTTLPEGLSDEMYRNHPAPALCRNCYNTFDASRSGREVAEEREREHREWEEATASRAWNGEKLFHGTRSELEPGTMLTPGEAERHPAHPDEMSRGYVHATPKGEEAAYWAEHADPGETHDRMTELGRDRTFERGYTQGHAYPPRVYEVEPTGHVESDPNGEGNSFRTAHPMRVVRQVHPLECWSDEHEGEMHWPDHPHYEFLAGQEDDDDEDDRSPHEASAVTANSDGDEYTTCDQGHEHWGTNGAAGLLVRHRGDDGQTRYLLQHRSPYVQHGGTWSTPGGAMGSDETPERAALREATEELGDLPHDLAHHHTVTDDHGGWAYHTVVMDSPRQFKPRGNGDTDWETSGYGWFTPHEVRELPLHPGFASSWDRVRKSGAMIPGPDAQSAREERGDRWHEFQGRYSPDTMHRGIHVHLPDDLHDYVHDESVPREDRAHALQQHFGREGLGMHWTPHVNIAHRAILNAADEDEASHGAWRTENTYGDDDETWYRENGYTDYDDEPEEPEGHGATDVMFHISTPGERNRLRNPEQLDRYNVGYDYSHDEHEMPLKPGSPVRMTGISWRRHEPEYPSEPFEHVDFPKPVRHTSSKAAAAPAPRPQEPPRGVVVLDSCNADRVLAAPAILPDTGFLASAEPENAAELRQWMRDLPALFRALHEGLSSVAGELDGSPVDEEITALVRKMASSCLSAAEEAEDTLARPAEDVWDRSPSPGPKA